MDGRGACIFHSRDVAWKRANDFKGRFLQLVQLLDADGEQKDYDFAEFVFVGNEAGTKSGPGPILRIADTTFRRQAFFTGASFLDALELEGVDFKNGATFVQAGFAHGLSIKNARFGGLDFSETKLAEPASFTKVEFLSFALFENARFAGAADGYLVKFEEARFEGLTTFTGAAFESGVGFLKVQFEDVTDFKDTQFKGHVAFVDTSFGSVTEFIDTLFATVGSPARFRGAAVEFDKIAVPARAVLSFVSNDPQRKMFDHDVLMSFKEEPAGIVRFNNVNFSKFTPASKDLLSRLAKFGRVEIGPGCIKYRLQNEVRTICVSQGNAPLVFEICRTFANYFTASNGINLGLEIVERDKTKVSFFYYTDEDLTQADFLERLAQAEQGLWNLLAIRPDEQILALEGPTSAAISTARESAVINAVDGVSALLGTFFRVGARLALGAWKEADTKALLSAIRFNDEGAESRALSLHQVLVDKYTGRALFGFIQEQNKLLAPMPVRSRESTSGKVGILFLGANSMSTPLELDKEVSKIQLNLKLARERDNLELKQMWAVTVDTLMQAMLDESPTIVHFSGHGVESGIILQDEMNQPKIVSAEALSDLFKLFKDTVHCVVLSSCYSEPQARAIRRHVPHVIGMRSDMPDPAAVAFSTGFYKALGAGRDIPFAFELGKAAIRLEGHTCESVLILL
jgi:uncharacterized protein YjbI with pentapeptide repeats